MFSPEAAAQGSRNPLRNPRRRQRKDSDGPQQPRRKRNKLAQDAFPANGNALVNGITKPNGQPAADDDDQTDTSAVLVAMPMRERQLPVKRHVKEDPAQYLTKNDTYSVKKLPCFPVDLAQIPFRAFALPQAGLALALTSSHALAWDYTAATGPARTVTLPLPFASASRPSDPLPLGAIVRNGTAGDFGVLAVSAARGKIVYWENVDSAEVRGHFVQRPQAVEGSVKIYSGEVVTDLVDLEHAGYVVVFSSGRTVQLTLRDANGRANITTYAMNVPNSSGGSFFSFKGLLGTAFRRSIAAVKAHQSISKGHLEVVTATKTGVFHIWDMSWSGQHMFKGEIDARAELLAAMQGGASPESRGQQDVHLLDFALLSGQNSQASLAVMMLVALSGQTSTDYSLLDVDLSRNTAVVRRVIPIRNFYQDQLAEQPTGSLILPDTGLTAFVQFPGALVVASLAEVGETPDAQLLSDAGRPTFPFQDAVYLQEGRRLQFCGAAAEAPPKKEQRSSAVLFIQGYGMVRISAVPQPSDDGDIGRHTVTAKSKLEQATFFSSSLDNILDFSIRSRYTFGQDEVENAALEISRGILSSSYDYLDKITISMDDQILKRIQALRTLITHLQAEYPPMSSMVRWQLLWNAEKLSAALALWNLYEETIRDQQARPEAYPDSLMIPHMVLTVHESFKTRIQPELGETDPTRQFFIRDIASLDKLIPHAWHTLRHFFLNNTKQKVAVMQRLVEGTEAVITGLDAAFNFRKANLELYGFDPHDFSDGLLRPNHGQDVIPNFWTSTHNMVGAIRSLVDVGRNLAAEAFEHLEHEAAAMKIAQENPRLVKLCSTIHIERFTWALSQSNDKDREMGKRLQEEWNKQVRPEQIYGLITIGMAMEGMSLAEEYYDMPTLARLIWNETSFLEETKEVASSKLEQAECTLKLNRIKDRIHDYFNKYGDRWAKAFYQRYIEERRSEQLFHKDFLNQPALTEYLRSNLDLGKLAWVNEVSGEKDYEAAHDALVYTATVRETNAWCKKVELSIAKLSLLCAHEPDAANEAQPSGEDIVSKLGETEKRLEYVEIQDRLYERLAPTIEGALDNESAVQLLMTEYGQGPLNERPAHQQLVKQAFENLVNHRVLEPALLIDVFTLMTYDETAEPVNITQSNEFAFALKALVLSWPDLNKTTRKSLLRLIWKRLCIKDNWAEISKHAKEWSDEAMAENLTSTAVGWTIKNLIGMISEDSFSQVASPGDLEKLLGAGCTNGELCVRFASEDLRDPIIRDNLEDDELLRTNLEKHRLAEWFVAASDAARRFYEREQANGIAQESLEDGAGSAVGASLANGTTEQTYASIAATAGTGDVVMQE